ncbi:helix-turn-helix domain-containing protein [Streptomyces sp. NPDC005791]|uniref:helix-turn-helix domain-containing protein n=1 Tax=Streptomyces sp. NPDC005791 TaxID=3364732 RepID=UPI0036B3EBC4
MTGERPDHRAAARELGAALRSLQQRSGRTLRSLEAEVRISDSSLSRYFRGETVPAWSAVRDLCRALGADPTPYRVLWEAVGNAPPDEPATGATGAGTGVATDAVAAGPAWWPWWRGPRAGGRGLLNRRAAVAAAAVVAAALVTVWLLLPPSGTPETPPVVGSGQGARGGPGGSGSAGVLVHNVEKACQEPRTTRCALSLAYSPYRPYTTTNSAGRVWHHDLLHATCTIADGVTVTDEAHDHTSIWIRTTHNGEQLWLPGIRVRPDHLTELTAVLPTCAS